MSKNVLYKFINLLLINSIHKQEKNVYIVKKSGWYVIRMESHSEAISEKYNS